MDAALHVVWRRSCRLFLTGPSTGRWCPESLSEVVHALQRGARRGFLDLGSIMRMVKAHYGAGGGGRWIEEEEENGRLETPAQDGYHSYSSDDEFREERSGGLSPSGIKISHFFSEADEGEVSESKYVSPRADMDQADDLDQDEEKRRWRKPGGRANRGQNERPRSRRSRRRYAAPHGQQQLRQQIQVWYMADRY